MREKYTNNIAFLFKRNKDDNTLDYSPAGKPFFCNRETQNKSSLNPMTGTYMNSSNEILKTTTQLNFEEHDHISYVAHPNEDQKSVIVGITVKPMLDRGSKYRTVQFNEYWITIS